MEQLGQMVKEQQALGQELLFANIFHDAIRGSEWLREQPFSPERAAIGYPFMLCIAF